MLTARSSQRARGEAPEALPSSTQEQFGGIQFGVGAFGIGIPAIGSAGLGGVRGGLFSGGSPGVGGGGIGPLLTLEQAFGSGFTSESVSDAIRVSEQEGRFSGETFPNTIDIATGPALSIVLNLSRGLFEIFDNASGAKIGGGVTPQAAIDAVNLGGGPPATGGGVLLFLIQNRPRPFPKRLRLSQLRRFKPPPPPLASSFRVARMLYARWRRYLGTCFGLAMRRPTSRRSRNSRAGLQTSPLHLLPLGACYRAELLTLPSFWDPPGIPPAYVVRHFRIKTNSAQPSKSAGSSEICLHSAKQGRTPTSKDEHSSNFYAPDWRN